MRQVFRSSRFICSGQDRRDILDPDLFEVEEMECDGQLISVLKFYAPKHEWLQNPIFLSAFGLSSQYSRGIRISIALICTCLYFGNVRPSDHFHFVQIMPCLKSKTRRQRARPLKLDGKCSSKRRLRRKLTPLKKRRAQLKLR